MKTLISMIAIVVIASTVNAGVIESASNRTAFANSDNGLGLSNTDSDSSAATGDWLADLSVDSYGAGPGGFSSSYQDSTINPRSYSGNIYNYLAADPDGDPFNLPSSYAASDFSVDFTLTSMEEFTITGWINPYRDYDDVTSDITVSIINLGGGGSPTQVIASASDADYVPFNVTDTLLAGDYRFEVATVVTATASFIDFYISGGADATWDMTLTPEPASLALLAMGGMVCLRRRR